jgi:hypothetical protein
MKGDNAYAIIAYITRQMKSRDYSPEEIAEYQAEAKSSDYTNLCKVSHRYARMIDHMDEVPCEECDMFADECECDNDDDEQW